MDELKPCPFCGYNMANEEDGAYQKAGFVGPQTPVWEVCCGGSTACNASVSATSRESAITAWNTRPREDAGVVDAEDAARYRWLRDNCFINRTSGRDFPHAVIEVCVGSFQGGIGWMHPGHAPGVGIPSLDKAVDAARKAALAAALGKSNG